VRKAVFVVHCGPSVEPAPAIDAAIRKLRPRWRIISIAGADSAPQMEPARQDVVVLVFSTPQCAIEPAGTVEQVLLAMGHDARDRVIPVVVGEGRIPGANDLPEPFRWLAFINGVPVKTAAEAAAPVVHAIENRATLAEPQSPGGLVRSIFAHAFLPMCFAPFWGVLVVFMAVLGLCITIIAMYGTSKTSVLEHGQMGGWALAAIVAVGAASGARIARRMGCVGIFIGGAVGLIVPWLGMAVIFALLGVSIGIRSAAFHQSPESVGLTELLISVGIPGFLVPALLSASWLARRANPSNRRAWLRIPLAFGSLFGTATIVAAAVIYRHSLDKSSNAIISLIALPIFVLASILMGLFAGACDALGEPIIAKSRPRGLPLWVAIFALIISALPGLSILLCRPAAWLLGQLALQATATAGIALTPAVLIAAWALAWRLRRSARKVTPENRRWLLKRRVGRRWIVAAASLGLAVGIGISTLVGHRSAPRDEHGKLVLHEELFADILRLQKWSRRESPSMAGTEVDLGDDRLALNEYTEAEPLYRDAIGIYLRSRPVAYFKLSHAFNQLANIMVSQGRYAEAEPIYSQSLSAYRHVSPQVDADLVVLLDNLASNEKQAGNLKLAESYYTQALAIRRRMGVTGSDLLDALNTLASIRNDLKQYKDAETLYVEALDLTRKKYANAGTAGVSEIVNALGNLGRVRRFNGHPEGAEALYTESVDLYRRNKPDDSKSIANLTYNLAIDHKEMAKTQQAESEYMAALAIYRRINGDPLTDILPCLNGLIGLKEAGKHREDAEPFYLQAIEIQRRLGQTSDLALLLSGLGSLESYLGHPTQAEANFREAVELFRKLPNTESENLAAALLKLAIALAAQNRTAESLPLYAESAALFRKSDPWGLNLVFTLQQYCRTQAQAQQFHAAEQSNQEAIQILRKLYPKGRPVLATTLVELGNLRRLQKRPTEAVDLYNEAGAMYGGAGAEYTSDVIACLQDAAVAWEDVPEYDKAEESFANALTKTRATGIGGAQLAQLLNNLGMVRLMLNRPNDALLSFQESLQIYRSTAPGDSFEIAAALNNVGGVWRDLKDYLKAASYFQSAVDMYHRLSKDENIALANSLSNLALCLHYQGKQNEARQLIDQAVSIIGRIQQPNEFTVKRILERQQKVLAQEPPTTGPN
jgi:hypothetical protein